MISCLNIIDILNNWLTLHFNNCFNKTGTKEDLKVDFYSK